LTAHHKIGAQEKRISNIGDNIQSRSFTKASKYFLLRCFGKIFMVSANFMQYILYQPLCRAFAWF